MSCTREKFVAQARAWLGLKESDGSHKKIIDIYNSHKPLAVGYTLKYTDAWCSGFVSAVAIACDATDIVPTEVGCGRHIALFQKMGIWVENDAYVPEFGDIIFYYWSDTGSGDRTNGASHVGIVEKVDGSTITVIEGNYSNAVKRRTIQVNGRYIRGFGIPKFDEAEGETSVESSEVKPAPAEPSYSLDRFIRDVQLVTGATVDGDAGTQTMSKTVTLNTSVGQDKHILVYLVQKRLKALGYVVGDTDGDYGSQTKAAVIEFQEDNGCTADGDITKGQKTWRCLFGK